MKKIKPFLPYALIVAALLIGRWTAPDDSKDLVKKYELERKYHLNEISKLNKALVDRDKAGQQIVKKMHLDSIRFSVDLKAKEMVILKQKQAYEKISYRGASAEVLDSAVNVLFPD